MTDLKLADYSFKLPNQLIAQTPARPRDQARLLVYNRATKQLSDTRFYELDNYLPPETTLVFNNSKVNKCRLSFKEAEIFELETIDQTTIKALVRPGKKFRPGKDLTIQLKAGELDIKTLKIEAGGTRILRLGIPLTDKRLDPYRKTPFPPYVTANESLAAQYQTVFAKLLGSKAAPTAGLHFTSHLLSKLYKSHQHAEVTLHIGLGTFAAIDDTDIRRGRLHSENFIISTSAAKTLNRAQHLTAIGTTTVRVLESATRPFRAQTSSTDILIMPGHRFSSVNALITNFHLPRSSPMILTAAFIGSASETKRIYNYAIRNKYCFYSFGDALLIL